MKRNRVSSESDVEIQEPATIATPEYRSSSEDIGKTSTTFEVEAETYELSKPRNQQSSEDAKISKPEPSSSTSKSTIRPKESTSESSIEPKPSTSKSSPEPKSSTSKSSPEPKLSTSKSSPEPKLSTSKSSPESKPYTSKSSIESKPYTSKSSIESKPSTSKSSPEPKPSTSKYSPEPSTSKYSPEPEPSTSKYSPEPEPSTSKSMAPTFKYAYGPNQASDDMEVTFNSNLPESHLGQYNLSASLLPTPSNPPIETTSRITTPDPQLTPDAELPILIKVSENCIFLVSLLPKITAFSRDELKETLEGSPDWEILHFGPEVLKETANEIIDIVRELHRTLSFTSLDEFGSLRETILSYAKAIATICAAIRNKVNTRKNNITTIPFLTPKNTKVKSLLADLETEIGSTIKDMTCYINTLENNRPTEVTRESRRREEVEVISPRLYGCLYVFFPIAILFLMYYIVYVIWKAYFAPKIFTSTEFKPINVDPNVLGDINPSWIQQQKLEMDHESTTAKTIQFFRDGYTRQEHEHLETDSMTLVARHDHTLVTEFEDHEHTFAKECEDTETD